MLCCFIKNQYGGVLENHSRYRDPLLLTSREPISPLPHTGAHPFGEGIDKLRYIGCLSRRSEFRSGRIRARVPEIGLDRVVEEIRLLSHDTYGIGQRIDDIAVPCEYHHLIHVLQAILDMLYSLLDLALTG